MPCGHPSTGVREEYAQIELKKDTLCIKCTLPPELYFTYLPCACGDTQQPKEMPIIQYTRFVNISILEESSHSSTLIFVGDISWHNDIMNCITNSIIVLGA